MTLPSEVPVMVLPNATLFPSTALPLLIFEDRYRAMLARVLETHRMFSVALMKPGVDEASSESDFFQVGGLGLVRACVARQDGTSSLMLVGIARVRYVGYVQTRPFRVARIEPIGPIGGDLEAAGSSAGENPDGLGKELTDLCARLRDKGVHLPAQLRNCLETSAGVDVIADVVASEFVSDALVRQTLLEEPRLERRLRTLLGYLAQHGA